TSGANFVKSAANAANYFLVNSSGVQQTIAFGSVGSSSVTLTNNIINLTVNGGAPLPVDSYTLFVRGDKVFESTDAVAPATAPELIVSNGFAGSNGGSSNKSTINVVALPGDGTLGAISDYSQAASGNQAANPYAVVTGDLSGLGASDLVVVNAGTNTVNIYQA